ncbi:MAG: HEPN domain-containing protein [Spirochaetes bacterium]|nr:HEPN domain-containing protein [Spirochaetota bacterium]
MSYKKDVVDYRRQRARETLADARTLFQSGGYSSAVNRIYYALFYEIIALLLIKDLSSPKHSGVRALFHQHCIKSDLISRDIGRLFDILFEFRQKGDYGDFVTFDREKVEEWLARADDALIDLESVIGGLLEDNN